MTTQTKTIWDFLEKEPRWAKETKALFEWSLNYDYPQRPFNLMLDLIGWSDDNAGAPMSEGVRLGYLEASYLGDALKEWADSPHEVVAWINELMECEG